MDRYGRVVFIKRILDGSLVLWCCHFLCMAERVLDAFTQCVEKMGSAGWAMEETNYEGLRATVQEVGVRFSSSSTLHKTTKHPCFAFPFRVRAREDGCTSVHLCTIRSLV